MQPRYWKLSIIHPNSAAEFTVQLPAAHAEAAYFAGYEYLRQRFGADTLYMVGEVERAPLQDKRSDFRTFSE